MRFGQVVYVDVVADACAIGRGIVGTENLERFALALDGFKSGWNQMGFWFVKFTNGSVLIGSCGVEVSEAYVTEPVGAGISLQRILECQFCGSVWVHWITRGVFSDWYFV